MMSGTPPAFAHFQNQCADLSSAELAELEDCVHAHVVELTKAQERSEFVAVDLAVQIEDRLARLFAVAAALPPAHRALVVGAARYFISGEDAIPDTRACTGLDDDVRIVNHVLTELGRGEWLIEE
jgi:uncharacterized membrane protein YkvA (DUF1232 family)